MDREAVSEKRVRRLMREGGLHGKVAQRFKQTTIKALEMAVQRRCPERGLLHHSDRGCTYTCEDYQRYLASRAIGAA